MTQYTVVQNTTGFTIPKGTVVGFAGVGSNNVLSVAPYLADGSSPSLYILGIIAEVGGQAVLGDNRKAQLLGSQGSGLRKTIGRAQLLGSHSTSAAGAGTS